MYVGLTTSSSFRALISPTESKLSFVPLGRISACDPNLVDQRRTHFSHRGLRNAIWKAEWLFKSTSSTSHRGQADEDGWVNRGLSVEVGKLSGRRAFAFGAFSFTVQRILLNSSAQQNEISSTRIHEIVDFVSPPPYSHMDPNDVQRRARESCSHHAESLQEKCLGLEGVPERIARPIVRRIEHGSIRLTSSSHRGKAIVGWVRSVGPYRVQLGGIHRSSGA